LGVFVERELLLPHLDDRVRRREGEGHH
jgi:hypothetical protein